VFRYKALNDQSEYVEGELNLASEQLVLEELLKLGYVPIKIWSDKSTAGRGRLLPRRRFRFEIEPFFENLSDYLDSGLAVDKALPSKKKE
jgi:type II secretory pathway component PulF